MDKPQTASFIGTRWRGKASLSKLYWRDMLIVGSVINLLAGFAALMIAAQGGDPGVAAIVHFLCLPYNVFLVLALWRTPGCSRFMAWTSLVWLGTVTVI
ncbi:MAG: hypothetical protein KJ614_13010 [Gammaproteobacteria bacterium]|uniref:hypothetical protein n=1 Tax=Rhodoferax sp. TaxID=50421 RepID=UPI0017E2317D|nr:hypothetical protein [Rhodoferax sp.]MBU3899824.1 hypothetical protein [Gammaproteobacteria bacterium]MBA3059831.1 hypothetical protein [Rhodoferax sp.]MBU3998855.1 hypothetical protein [Gammaproteobacteria bacterium]MBU4019088.1 hypothetical protein [Gammaproteobacteria bacterium]MBU4078807.1 hypothetical protein [Gammaproteobacteria bacterium]